MKDVSSALDALVASGCVDQLSGRSLLVTGARGYLGRYVVALLLEFNRRQARARKEGCRIWAMDSLLLGDDERAEWRNQDGLVFIQHDVRHHFGGMRLERIDYVLHLAGIASPTWYQQYPLETIAVAVDGTRNMLELAKDQGARILFSSSSEVYQTAEVVPTPESYVGAVPSMTERSSYDCSKLLGETLCYVYATKEDVHATVVRIFNSFGSGMRQKDQRILPRIASAMKSGTPLRVFASEHPQGGHPYVPGGVLPRRTYTPVANTLFGLFLALLRGERAPGGVYNLGLEAPEVTVPQLCNLVERVTGRTVPLEYAPPPDNYASEPMRRCPDIARLKGLGFQPVVNLEEGLRRFFDWALEVYV